MKIGLIGLGNMGNPMARNLVRAECDVAVYDIDPMKTAAVEEEGATGLSSAEEVAAQADILFTSLPGPMQVRAVMPGLLEKMKQGSVWVDTTTSNRKLLKEMADKAAGNGVATVEAPVTGAVDGARQGRLTIFVGGDPKDIERVEPYFNVIGKVVIHCGPLGNASPVKIVSNQLWFITVIGMTEAMLVAKKSGVELRTIWEGMQNSVADSYALRRDAPSLFAGHFDPTFSLGLVCKDLGLAMELGEEAGVQMDLTRMIADKFQTARDKHGEDAPELLACKDIEEASGSDLRLEGDWPKKWEM